MKLKFLIIAFAFFFLILVVTLSQKVISDTGYSNRILDNQGNNNAIVTNIWLDDTTKLDEIKNHKIKYLIVDVGNTGENGSLLTSKDEIDYFLKFIEKYEKANNYDFILLPYSEINTYTYNMTPEFEDNFIQDYYNLNLIGFDGIFVDIEPVKFEQRGDYLSLLSRLRSKLGDDKIISVYSGHISEDLNNEWGWSLDFLKEVSHKTDIISVPVYDTDYKNRADYQDFVKYTLDKILTNTWDSYFFLAVPTHKNSPETLDNVISVYSKEIKKYPDNNLLGIDIFAEWTIDDKEWKTVDQYLKQSQDNECKNPLSHPFNFISCPNTVSMYKNKSPLSNSTLYLKNILTILR
ncbi:Uncharacterised protein [uncultured archaeon]|nr:Uncharacterised protein [uncultured archaeon]